MKSRSVRTCTPRTAIVAMLLAGASLAACGAADSSQPDPTAGAATTRDVATPHSAVTSTSKPASAASATSGTTPATTSPDSSGFEGQLSTYTDEQLGFEFDYPSVYDQEPYQACGPQSFESADATQVTMGPGIVLSILPADGRTVDSFVDQMLADMQSDAGYRDIEIDRDAAAGDLVGIGISYRFGGTNRFAFGFIFGWQDNIYVAQYLAYGGFICDVPEASVRELELLSLMLETFRFSGSSP